MYAYVCMYIMHIFIWTTNRHRWEASKYFKRQKNITEHDIDALHKEYKIENVIVQKRFKAFPILNPMNK